MTNQICFIGEFGAGKSHTIRELFGNRSVPEIIVSDRFASVTSCETIVTVETKIGGKIDIIDTRGLDSEDFSDEEIITAINEITNPITIFVLVINARERRVSSIKLARQIIRDRRFLVYDNYRDSEPINVEWYKERPSAERCEAIADLLGKNVADITITNKQWAIGPYLRLILTGTPCNDPTRIYFNFVAAYLEESNQVLLEAHKKVNSKMNQNLDKISIAQRLLDEQIKEYEHQCLLFRAYKNYQLEKAQNKCPEEPERPAGRSQWSTNRFLADEIRTSHIFNSTNLTVRAYACAIAEISHEVGASLLEDNRRFTVPILPKELREWTPKEFVPKTRVCLTFDKVF